MITSEMSFILTERKVLCRDPLNRNDRNDDCFIKNGFQMPMGSIQYSVI